MHGLKLMDRGEVEGYLDQLCRSRSWVRDPGHRVKIYLFGRSIDFWERRVWTCQRENSGMRSGFFSSKHMWFHWLINQAVVVHHRFPASGRLQNIIPQMNIKVIEDSWAWENHLFSWFLLKMDWCSLLPSWPQNNFIDAAFNIIIFWDQKNHGNLENENSLFPDLKKFQNHGFFFSNLKHCETNF